MHTARCGCSASVVSGTPCSRASAAVASDVGTATMPSSSPSTSRRPIAIVTKLAVEPVPSPSAMPLRTSAATAASAAARLASAPAHGRYCAAKWWAVRGVGPAPVRQ